MITFFLSTFASLFSIVNPLGAMPVFVSLTGESSAGYRRNMALRAALFMASILMVFLVFGKPIMDFFGITFEAMRIAGGLIIIKAGYDLLNSGYSRSQGLKKKVKDEARNRHDIAFSPLAMPMLSGPGAIALVIGMGRDLEKASEYGLVAAAILSLSLLTFLVLNFSPRWVNRLGKTGLLALTRMMGFFTLCIGVQYIANGASPLLEKIFLR